ncbi:M56 family metallopeptidase [Cerasicoccus maritimus]|uniref:M56 family metallopeptidase n=1 Tax=Cerasicoccus maritimus TaxID=490089 RepID=UPI00285269D1|nr:M56 family metallopeptidase [Cerasicoccus maritimus]
MSNTLEYLIELPVMQRIGWALLHFVWQGALIDLLAGLLFRLPVARRASVSYAISVASLVLCALAPMATFYVVQPMAVVKSDVAPPEPLVVAHSEPVKPLTVVQAVPAANDLGIPKASALIVENPPESDWREVWSQRAAPYVPWLVVGWFPIAVLLSLRLTIGWRMTRVWVSAGKEIVLPVDLQSLKQRMGVTATVRVLESVYAKAPMVVGALKPVILIPVGFLTMLTPEQVEAILLHELAHIRRHDYLVNFVQSYVTAILFYHPVVWWLNRKTVATRELCCDAMSAEEFANNAEYAQALASLEFWRQNPPTLATAASDGSLLQRIRALAGQSTLEGPNVRAIASLAAVFSLSLGLSLAVYSSELNAETDAFVRHRQAPPTGTVVGPNGNPVAGAQVSLYHLKYFYGLENGVVDSVRTDEEGRFQFSDDLLFNAWQSDPERERYYVVAEADGLALDVRAIKPTTVTQDMQLQLSEPELRTVMVQDKDGQPVAGADVWVHSISANGHGAFFQPAFGSMRAETDAAGKVEFKQLPKGSVVFAAEKAGLSPNWSGCGSGKDNPSTVCLRPGASVSGVVRMPNGQPAAGIMVYATPNWPLSDYTFTRTDAQGRYNLTGLYGKGDAWDDSGGTGSFTMGVEDPMLDAQSQQVQLDSGQAIKGINFVAQSGTPVQGVILDPVSLEPLAGIRIFVRHAGGELYLLSGEDGEFDFRAPPGEAYISVWAPTAREYFVNGANDDARPHFMRFEVYQTKLDLKIYAPSAVKPMVSAKGRVLMPDGSPAVNAEVIFRLNVSRSQIVSDTMKTLTLPSLKTNDLGEFVCKEYPIGVALQAVVRKGDFARVIDVPAIEADGETLPDIQLEPALKRTIQIVDIDGAPLKNVEIDYGPQLSSEPLDRTISVAPVSRRLQHRLKTDGQGMVELRPCIPGYSMDFWLADVAVSWKRVLPPLLEGNEPLVYTLSDRMWVQFIGPDGEALQIKELATTASGLIGQNEHAYVPLTTDGLSAEQVQAGWRSIAKEKVMFYGPGAKCDWWAELEDGVQTSVKGVFPEFSNTLQLVAEHIEQADGLPLPEACGADDIALYIQDVDGNPIAGAKVVNDPHRGRDSVSGESNVDGWCILPNARNLRIFYIEITHPDYAPQWISLVPEGQAAPITLHQQTRLQGQMEGPNGELTGKVSFRFEARRPWRDSRGEPREMDDIFYDVESDENGAYDFMISPGRYRLVAESERGYSLVIDSLEVKEGAVNELPAKMSAGAEVVFTLRDSKTGEPVVGFPIYVGERIGPYHGGIRKNSMRVTDKNGQAIWEHLPVQQTRFSIASWVARETKCEYTRWWSHQHVFFGEQHARFDSMPPTGPDGTNDMVVDLKEGLNEFNITAERGIRVSGTVKLPEEIPDGSITATIAPVRDRRSSFSGDSRANVKVDRETGKFAAFLPAGNGIAYRLCVYHTIYGNSDERRTLPAAISAPFESKAGELFTFDLSMLGGGFVKGRVVDAEGQPASDITVRAIPLDHAGGIYEEPKITTLANGEFQMGPIRSAEYAIITERGYQWRSKPNAAAHAAVVDRETVDLGIVEEKSP